MPPAYLKLAADLLRLASDEFSNHGCNDMELPDWTQDERDGLDLQMHIANGDPENFEPGRRWFQDHAVMRFLAGRLESAGDIVR